jgi:hypothetical protein
MFEMFFLPINTTSTWRVELEARAETHNGKVSGFLLPILKSKIYRQILLKLLSTKFHEDPFRGSEVVSCVQMDERT